MLEPTANPLTNELEAYHKAKSFLQAAFEENAKIDLTNLIKEAPFAIEHIIAFFAKRKFIGGLKYGIMSGQIYSTDHPNAKFACRQFLKILDIIVTYFPNLTPKVIEILLDQEFDKFFVEAKYDEHVDLYLTILEKIQSQGHIEGIDKLIARYPKWGKEYNSNFWGHFIYKLVQSKNEKNIIKLFKLLETQIKKADHDKNAKVIFNLFLEQVLWILSIVIFSQKSKPVFLAYMSLLEETYNAFPNHQKILGYLLLGFATIHGYPYVLRSRTIAYEMACLKDISFACLIMFFLTIETLAQQTSLMTAYATTPITKVPNNLNFLSSENLFEQRLEILAHINSLPKKERQQVIINATTPGESLHRFFNQPVDPRITHKIEQLVLLNAAETTIQQLLEQNSDALTTTNDKQAVIVKQLNDLINLDDLNAVVDILSQTDRSGRSIAFYLETQKIAFYTYLILLDTIATKGACPIKIGNLLSQIKQDALPLSPRSLFTSIQLTIFRNQIQKLGLANFIERTIQKPESFSDFLNRQFESVLKLKNRETFLKYFLFLETIHASNNSPLSQDKWCFIPQMVACANLLGNSLPANVIRQHKIINLLQEKVNNYEAVEHFLENLPKDNANPNEIADLLATTDEHGAHLGIYLARHIAEESKKKGLFGSFQDRHIVTYLKLLLLLLSKINVKPEKITQLLIARKKVSQPLILELKDKQSVEIFFEIAKKLPIHCRLQLFTEDLLFRFCLLSRTNFERQKTCDYLVLRSLELLHKDLLNNNAKIAEQILDILSVQLNTRSFGFSIISSPRVFSEASLVFLQILENVVTRFSSLIPKVSDIILFQDTQTNETIESCLTRYKLVNHLALYSTIFKKTQTPKEQLQIQDYFKQTMKDNSAIEAMLKSLFNSEYEPNTIIDILSEVDEGGLNLGLYLQCTPAINTYLQLLTSLLDREGSSFEKEVRAFKITHLLGLQNEDGRTLAHSSVNYDTFIELINRLPLDCQVLLLSIADKDGFLFLMFANPVSIHQYLKILHTALFSKDKEIVKTVHNIITKSVTRYPDMILKVIDAFFANAQPPSITPFDFFSQLFALFKSRTNDLLKFATEENKQKILSYIEKLPPKERMEACENVFKFGDPLHAFFSHASDAYWEKIQRLLDQDKQASISHSSASFHKPLRAQKVKGDTVNIDEEEAAEDSFGVGL